MSTRNIKNQLGRFKSVDCRSLSARHRAQATRKMSDVALELVDEAIASGIKAKYVLFDSWYSSPRMFSELLKRQRDGIGMLKKTKKVYFRYRGREMDVKLLYSFLRRSKWSTKTTYLYSPIVTFEVDGQTMPMKLVYVTKRGQSDQYHGFSKPIKGSKIPIPGAIRSTFNMIVIAPVIPPAKVLAAIIGNGAASAYGIAGSVATVIPTRKALQLAARSCFVNNFGRIQVAIAAAIGGNNVTTPTIPYQL